MAVKASFGNNSNHPNNNKNHSSSNDHNNNNNNNDTGNMHKEDASPCWSSYWKFLHPQDEMWIVTDNARSHETRRLLNPLESSSPEIHWDRTKDSVVGFCNAKTNRWGVSPLVPPLGESTSITSTSAAATSPTRPRGSGNSTRIKTGTKEPAPGQSSLESSISLEDTDSVRQDSVLMQPARRESLVILDPIDLGLIMPERRVSEDSVLTFRTSIGSTSLGTFASILEDVCSASEVEEYDDDDDDDDDILHDDHTIPSSSTATDKNDNSTNEDSLVESSSRPLHSNNKHHGNPTTKPPHSHLPGPPLRHHVSGTASDTSNNRTNIKLDGARRFAPMIRGTSLPNLDSSRNKGPSVPVRRSSACSAPCDVRSSSSHSIHGSSGGSGSSIPRRLSSFEAILEYEPMEDLPGVGPTFLRESSTEDDDDDDDDDAIDQRWIEADSGTMGNGKTFTLVPMDSLRLARHSTSTRPTTTEEYATTTSKEESSEDDDDDDDGDDPFGATNERRLLCVDEYDQCHKRSCYSPQRSTRNSIRSISSCQDPNDTFVTLPTTLSTSMDIAELGLDSNNDDDDNGNDLDPPPLIEMDNSPCTTLHNK